MEDIESSVQEDYSSRVIIGQDTRTQVFLAWNVASAQMDGKYLCIGMKIEMNTIGY